MIDIGTATIVAAVISAIGAVAAGIGPVALKYWMDTRQRKREARDQVGGPAVEAVQTQDESTGGSFWRYARRAALSPRPAPRLARETR